MRRNYSAATGERSRAPSMAEVCSALAQIYLEVVFICCMVAALAVGSVEAAIDGFQSLVDVLAFATLLFATLVSLLSSLCIVR